jgi:hypothetical protein
MYEKFLLCAIVFFLGAGAMAWYFCFHLRRVTDAFLDHLLLIDGAIEDRIKAEVAKRFSA